MKKTNSNYSGKKYLIESCQGIEVGDILNQAQEALLKNFLEYGVEIFGERVYLKEQKMHNGGIRFWMLCPICNESKRIIYRHPVSGKLGCRGCLRLDYASRCCKGMIENSI